MYRSLLLCLAVALVAIAAAPVLAASTDDPFESAPVAAPPKPAPRPQPREENPPPVAAVPQPPPSPPVVAPHFDEQRMRALATRLDIPLPAASSIVPASVPPGISSATAAYLGAWGGENRWGGQGRQAIVIVTNVDLAGNATGYYAQGGPTAQTYDQTAGKWAMFRGAINANGLKFTLWQYFNYTFLIAGASNSSMVGQVDGGLPEKPLHTMIILNRLP
jgi:hypothetical protein